MEKCTDPSMLALLVPYELGLLTRREMEEFEIHLMNCSACRESLEVAAADPVSGALRRQRAGAAEKVAMSKPGRRWLAGLTTVIHDWLEWFRRPVAWAPSLGAIAVFVAALMIMGMNPYDRIRTREKPSYDVLEFRGLAADGVNPNFKKGMEEYAQNDYAAAARDLRKALAYDSLRVDWWLYLGVSYYFAGKANPAIASLEHARTLDQGLMKLKAEWYMANAYLMKKDPVAAERLLEPLTENTPYEDRARDLLAKIKSIQR